ncbi:hypothetical protein OCU04_000924 [Sclerotinia nivalis]|uniref:Uncharacterized protein n=1 Tax=Sclerotinia nivalis TaxID=352851 RepID=A0A9X0AX47_9HELO|nr:hypothetical protein OCU04_000924 [Sclerotinia nivalis]
MLTRATSFHIITSKTRDIKCPSRHAPIITRAFDMARRSKACVRITTAMEDHEKLLFHRYVHARIVGTDANVAAVIQASTDCYDVDQLEVADEDAGERVGLTNEQGAVENGWGNNEQGAIEVVVQSTADGNNNQEVVDIVVQQDQPTADGNDSQGASNGWVNNNQRANAAWSWSSLALKLVSGSFHSFRFFND